MWWQLIMRDLDTKIVPGLTHWEVRDCAAVAVFTHAIPRVHQASNRFFAYFKPHSSYPAVLGELLCAGTALRPLHACIYCVRHAPATPSPPLCEAST